MVTTTHIVIWLLSPHIHANLICSATFGSLVQCSCQDYDCSMCNKNLSSVSNMVDNVVFLRDIRWFYQKFHHDWGLIDFTSTDVYNFYNILINAIEHEITLLTHPFFRSIIIYASSFLFYFFLHLNHLNYKCILYMHCTSISSFMSSRIYGKVNRLWWQNIDKFGCFFIQTLLLNTANPFFLLYLI